MTTAETITDDQIVALRREATDADDLLQVVCCDLALGQGATQAYYRLTRMRRLRAQAQAQWPRADDARAACARVIADAEARQG